MSDLNDDEYLSVLVEIMRDQHGNAVDEQLTFLVAPCDMIAHSLAQAGFAAAEADDKERDDGLRTEFSIVYLREVSPGLMQRLLENLRSPQYRAQWECDDLFLLLTHYRSGGLSESDEGFRQRLIAYLPVEVERLKKARADGHGERQDKPINASTLDIADQALEGA